MKTTTRHRVREEALMAERAQAADQLPETELRALYSGPLGDFVGRRTAWQRQLRANGDRDAAREVGALGKPSTAAWTANLLAADGRSALELTEVADAIAAALRDGDGEQLRELAAAQRIVVTEILDRAVSLADERGTRPSAAAREELEDAIRGVLGGALGVDALFTGVLTTLPATSDDALSALSFAAPVVPVPRRTERSRGGAKPAGGRSEATAAPAAADRRRQLREAQAALHAAQTRGTRAGRTVELLRRTLEELRAQVSQTEADLREAERDVDRATEQERSAQRAVERFEAG